MGKKLIITEKPSVAQDIARALGKFTDHKEYLENAEYIITWAVGHLVGLAEPEDYDDRFRKWDLELLPIIPEVFKLKPLEKTEKRLEVIKMLSEREDTDALVNACDAGREGELIFRYIYEFLGLKKPVFRLWLSSMTKEAIREAFARLRPASEYELLAQAAKCRSEGDWLVGINGSRAFTSRYRILLSVGRVQTPTLAILVHREREIQNFRPTPYFEVFARFRYGDLTYVGKWRGGEDDRLFDRGEAEKVVARVLGKQGKVEEFSEHKTQEAHPLLYDLTELQRDANKLFGYSAQKTLDIAQRLYEHYKLITYPRTDSRYLSEDLLSQVEKSVAMLARCGFAEFARDLPLREALKDRRVFDRSKVTDHHAIIPTGEEIRWEVLKEGERKVLDLIVRRFLAVFYPPAVWVHRTIRTRVEGEVFLSKTRVLAEPGWRVLYPREEEGFLPVVPRGEEVDVVEAWSEEKETKAPPRYTEATLLAAMEGAGRFVEDEELREVLKESGIGTPATRAAIIERLIEVGYVEREGKTLIPTPKGMELVSLVESIPIPELASPQLTGEWEKKLNLIQKGQFTRELFMEGIKHLTREIVAKVKAQNLEDVREAKSRMIASRYPLGSCPLCGAPVYESKVAFSCSRWKEGCTFAVWKTISGKKISRQQVQKLLASGRTDRLSGFRSRKGKRFSAVLVLSEDGKVEFAFPHTPSKVRAERGDGGDEGD
ncbi:DNA topoisomerase 3 [Candidatus Caldatribacterium saccharofermentans]|uniref:DNA topoisomerase n=1 Tax=Candidatus Caldatribacterium saccharofermentans TaxID=1454753 RepID=A0A7V4THR5_9BACT